MNFFVAILFIKPKNIITTKSTQRKKTALRSEFRMAKCSWPHDSRPFTRGSFKTAWTPNSHVNCGIRLDANHPRGGFGSLASKKLPRCEKLLSTILLGRNSAWQIDKLRFEVLGFVHFRFGFQRGEKKRPDIKGWKDPMSSCPKESAVFSFRVKSKTSTGRTMRLELGTHRSCYCYSYLEQVLQYARCKSGWHSDQIFVSRKPRVESKPWIQTSCWKPSLISSLLALEAAFFLGAKHHLPTYFRVSFIGPTPPQKLMSCRWFLFEGKQPLPFFPWKSLNLSWCARSFSNTIGKILGTTSKFLAHIYEGVHMLHINRKQGPHDLQRSCERCRTSTGRPCIPNPYRLGAARCHNMNRVKNIHRWIWLS